MNKLEQIKRKKYWIALISAIIVSVCVCVGVVMNLTTLHDENFDHMGLETFRMFTVDSNIVCGIAYILYIPYVIDALIKHDYHTPNWIIVLLHVGVTGVFLTFLISLFVLAPFKGFVLIFTGSRFFLHGLCPILAVIAFSVCIPSHRIRIRESFFCLVPIAIYAFIYLYQVVIVGEENGGWDDMYGFATKIPLWISCVSVLPLAYFVGFLPKWWHNITYRKNAKLEATYYLEEFKTRDVNRAIVEMADYDNDNYEKGNILIPRRTIEKMVEYSGNNYDIDELCHLYLTAFLDKRLMGNNKKK